MGEGVGKIQGRRVVSPQRRVMQGLPGGWCRHCNGVHVRDVLHKARDTPMLTAHLFHQHQYWENSVKGLKTKKRSKPPAFLCPEPSPPEVDQ